jgi:parvulin-like peptidyl-prolyl isomerase
VLANNFPGTGSGDAGQTAAVFKTAPGTLLREPVPGTDGYLVVRVESVSPRTGRRSPRCRARSVAGCATNRGSITQENDMRALYTSLRDSLSGPAWRFRWAAVDTATVRVAEPSEADLDRWYRGHLADFSSFDAASGTIVAKPLAQVRDEVRARGSVTAASRPRARRPTSSIGRGAPASARPPWSPRPASRRRRPHRWGRTSTPASPRPPLSDTVWKRGEPRGAGLARYARGYLVWQVTARVASHTPTFEQVSPALRVALDEREQAIEQAGARRLYEQDPKRFGAGKRYAFTRMVVPIPPLESVRLTRAEVERWHRQHLEKYSAPELVRASHILISPVNASPAADRAARTRADSLLSRIRAGESFSGLAARFSDDPATKDKGGDLGVFARGTMLQAFEDAAFAMHEGDLAGPVKTEVGYHIIRCTEHAAPFVQPLKLVYSIVAPSARRAKGTRSRCGVRTACCAWCARPRRGGRPRPSSDCAGTSTNSGSTNRTQHRARRLLRPPVQAQARRGHAVEVEGEGHRLLDHVGRFDRAGGGSTLGGRARARDHRLPRRRRRARDDGEGGRDGLAGGLRMVVRQPGHAWGGLKRSRELTAVGPDQRAGLPVSLDSLVFGMNGRPPALAEGQVSGWVRWPGGVARVRLIDREEPPRTAPACASTSCVDRGGAPEAGLLRRPAKALPGAHPRQEAGGDPVAGAARRGLNARAGGRMAA